MENNIKWRFPGNAFGQETGLSDSASEMFKGDILAGLAREIVQNSIDARLAKDSCVSVEFSCFDVDRKEIPGIDDITEQIKLAQATWKNGNKAMVEMLNDMLEAANSETIHCCRISDFNTTGLLGVSSDDQRQDSSWHYLIKGSGLSNKSETSGGSKGVGKYASFANSEFGTVFYSTLTSDNEKGYIGISKLCSAQIEGSDELTQGVGYYGNSDKNSAIPGQFQLDNEFLRSSSGTDVYIIGFVQRENWERDVIVKLLDSFMVALVFGTLELKVGKYSINKGNLHHYVYDEEIVSPKNSEGRNIITQYLLLTKVEEPYAIDVEGVGDAALYFLNCVDQYQDFKTDRSCIMVRYPYMKICNVKIGLQLPYAAMCIVGDNKLNSWLRDIENPQHVGWEFKRLNSKPEMKKELKRLFDDLINQITDYIRAQLLVSNNERVNLEGAEEFIPQEDDSENSNIPIESSSYSQKQKLESVPTLSKKKIKTKTFEIDAQIPDPEGNGVELDLGTLEGDDEDIVVPEGHNNGENGDIRPGQNPDRGSGSGDDKIVVKPTALRTMKYRFACLNKKEGRFVIIFISDYTEPDAVFEIYEVDENNNPERLSVSNAIVNGQIVRIENQCEIHVPLEGGKKTTIELCINRFELFSAEVKAYAYRQ